MNLNLSIPCKAFPRATELEEGFVDEPLVSLSGDFVVKPFYHRMGIEGALDDCYVRETVKEKLLEAQAYLPEGLKFAVMDGYRPLAVQEYLWNKERRKLQRIYESCMDEMLDEMTSKYVSKPSYDIYNPSVHNTGGAVDLTLITDNGYYLDMGTQFDDFSTSAWTDEFEDTVLFPEVKNNRRILYNAMTQAGFTNLPTEWWHFDYGDKFWAYYTGKPQLYKGILVPESYCEMYSHVGEIPT